MSEAGYTQGPWEVDGLGIYGCQMEGILEAVAHVQEYFLNSMGGITRFKSTAEANARLIAAAPELVDILAKLTRHTDRVLNCLYEFTRDSDGAAACTEHIQYLEDTLAQARTAIVKALGESVHLDA